MPSAFQFVITLVGHGHEAKIVHRFTKYDAISAFQSKGRMHFPDIGYVKLCQLIYLTFRPSTSPISVSSNHVCVCVCFLIRQGLFD